MADLRLRRDGEDSPFYESKASDSSITCLGMDEFKAIKDPGFGEGGSMLSIFYSHLQIHSLSSSCSVCQKADLDGPQIAFELQSWFIG